MSEESEAIETIQQKVYDLFEAANQGARGVAESILAQDYLPIIRASGHVDSSREETLERIGRTNSARLREVNKDAIAVTLFHAGTVAIARSKETLTLLDQSPVGVEDYWNLHVFVKRNGQWECIAWQVTRAAP